MLTRYNPFNDLMVLSNRLNRLFGYPEGYDEVEGTATWTPKADIKSNESCAVLSLELPGFTEKDIELTVEDNVLTVTGEKPEEKPDKGFSYVLNERFGGKFSRSFKLTHFFDHSKIKAVMKNGILTLEIPRREETKPQKIKIRGTK